MGVRRKGRECALKMLYLLEFFEDKEEAIRIFKKFFEYPEEVIEFAELLVKGIYDHLSEINDIISKISKRWKIERMSFIDRNVIRIGAYEIMYLEDIPYKVSINEAIEIAKKYGTEDSPSFVNGILDKIAEAIGKSRNK